MSGFASKYSENYKIGVLPRGGGSVGRSEES